MRVKTPDVSNVLNWEDLRRWVSQAIKDMGLAINGGIVFGENIPSTRTSATFSAANTEVLVSHGLGKQPNGYIVVGLSANIVVFNGTTPNTASEIYVQASGAGTAQLLIF